MSNTYGKKYPGSGGASGQPRTGGAGWHPLPPDTFYKVPVKKTVIEERQPGFFGRLLGCETKLVKKDVIVHETRKKYH